jgi:hypothetical protein
MEVKNPLFKEEFSSNSISAMNGGGAVPAATASPPAYTSVISNKQLAPLAPSEQAAPAVLITVNESQEEKKTSELSTE